MAAMAVPQNPAPQNPAPQNPAPESTALAKVSSASIEPHTLPILVGAALTPLAHLLIEVTGSEGTATLTSVVVEMSSSSELFESVQVLSVGDRDRLSTAANPDPFAGAEPFPLPPPAGVGWCSQAR